MDPPCCRDLERCDTVGQSVLFHFANRANWDKDLEKVPRFDQLPNERE
jgi:hypothetical protein